MQAAIHVKKEGGIAEWTKKPSFGESMNVTTPAQPHTRTVRSGMRGQKMGFFSPDNDRLVIIRSE
jgi:hypothetical protein